MGAAAVVQAGNQRFVRNQAVSGFALHQRRACVARLFDSFARAWEVAKDGSSVRAPQN